MNQWTAFGPIGSGNQRGTVYSRIYLDFVKIGRGSRLHHIKTKLVNPLKVQVLIEFNQISIAVG